MDGKTPLSAWKRSRGLERLIRQGIVVDAGQARREPSGFDEAVYCKACCANDFSIPGLEVDERGLCPICALKQKFEPLGNVLPVQETFPRANNSRYDVALFYTGGKDSSFLLYYLSRVLRLRVLALTWDIPYMSENARQSMEHAKKALPGVTFLIEKIQEESLNKIYRKAYSLERNTCICPSGA